MKNKGNPFLNISSLEILDKKPEGLEVAGYDDKDIMFIKAIAVHEGLNANNALMERADLHKARHTFVGKPLKIRFVNNNPTGHGYNPQTGEFDEITKAIGVIYSSDAYVEKLDGTREWIWEDALEEVEGQYQIVVHMGVWQKYYPEIAQRLRQLHASGDLAFSIEAERDFEEVDGVRKCFNITFNGLAVVKTPAFEDARSLMVAELLSKTNEGGSKTMDFEKMYKDLLAEHQTLSTNFTIEKQGRELAEKRADEAEGKVAELAEAKVTLEGDLKTAQADLKVFKDQAELAEKKKVGQERFEKLQKYGEVAKTVEELAEMTKEQFVDELAEAVENFDPATATNRQENAEKDDVQGAYFSTEGNGKVSRKDNLLAFVTGLAK